ncbi:glycosyltransferase family 2 protein [Phocaeicola faecalis]|uniref:glycosyltransferase family 2 protein n=1 Tax=Phocaeicola faecalis TaxID=2786956 RepID=UPI001F23F3FC|nr:glycosyltransferase family 2 protein [Phocaeicola faecalis]
MSTKISVIIPVYNVEAYVERCIRSLFDQTFINFEAIAVDDGSTDQSGVILDRLQKEDSRLKVFHQSNGGVSRARNFAMQQAIGDFFCFLDSDDTYQPEMLETLVTKQEQTQADLIVTSYSFYHEDTEQRETVDCLFEGTCDKNKSMQLMFQPHGYRCYLFTKLFKKSLVKSSDAILSFHSNLRMMEDMVFVAEYVARCQTVAFINESYYNYLMRADSAIHTTNTKEKIKAFEAIVPFVTTHFNSLCSDTLRWSYYVSLLGDAHELVSQNQCPPSSLMEAIRKERNHFLLGNKYSIMGYLKHLSEEMLLRFYMFYKSLKPLEY